jgi:hypothetical protein
LPNWICGRCSNPDDFGDSGSGNAIVDFGKFLTGFLVVMGIGKYFQLLVEQGVKNMKWCYGSRGEDLSVE